MTEIHSLGTGASERFARDKQAVEAFRQQYHDVRPSDIARQTTNLSFVPTYSALALLMGTHQNKMWARMTVPEGYFEQRESSSHIAPSLGSSEKQQADINKLHQIVKEKGEEEEKDSEGAVLIQLLENIRDNNELVDYIKSRIREFVQA